MVDGRGLPDSTGIDPTRIVTLADLAYEWARLRRRAAGKGQVQISVRQIAARTGRAPSTLDPYLRGRRLAPADTYEEILRALGIPAEQLRPWLDAWERIADAEARTAAAARTVAAPGAPGRVSVQRERPLRYTEEFRYELTHPAAGAARIGIVTGDLRRVRCAEVWLNPENTDMRMARFEEHSVSAIVRYEGARRDETGLVVEDTIADELARRIAGRGPVAPGTVITTGPGELAGSNGVRHVIHVAAVHGQPGEGYRQVADVGRCMTNALAEVARLGAAGTPVTTVLSPLLGVATGGGELVPTVSALLGAAIDHLVARPAELTVYFLAYTDVELAVCRSIFTASSRLRASPAHA